MNQLEKQGSRVSRKERSAHKVRANSGGRQGEKILKSLSMTNQAQSHQKIKNFLNKLEQDMQQEAMDPKNLGMSKMKSIKPEFKASNESALLTHGDTKFEIPIIVGTNGQKQLDIQTLYGKAKLFNYDPGFGNTSSCKSAISNTEAEGKLYYRGYDVCELAEKSTFLETCFILLYGRQCYEDELKEFEERIMDEMHIKTQMNEFYKGFKSDADPMSILCSVVAGLSSFLHQHLDIKETAQRELTAIKLIARMPVLAANAFRVSMGLPIVQCKRNLSYMENFLRMMFQDPMQSDFQVPQLMVTLMEKLFILHADCEQGPSTTAVRVAGSSLANPFAAISAGVGSLWGVQHGGTTKFCIAMFQEIEQGENIGLSANVAQYLEDIKDKSNKRVLYGFGHRVFKSYDPRAAVVKQLIIDFQNNLGVKEPLFDIACALEVAAMKDEYFAKRNLFPNINYWSCILLRLLQIPENMFNIMFAIPRSTGWIANWREMMGESVIKIYRPRQIYVGQPLREFVPMKDRKPAAAFTLTSSKN